MEVGLLVLPKALIDVFGLVSKKLELVWPSGLVLGSRALSIFSKNSANFCLLEIGFWFPLASICTGARYKSSRFFRLGM